MDDGACGAADAAVELACFAFFVAVRVLATFDGCARGARRLEERRVEREAAEERRREDRTEARQHIQDMLMMLAALQNGTMPGVRM
ncbi:hypothetical protein PC128_g9949 [Phytophthora cactorum]|nr:hypothetical protein PC128_g9949 [Phytophthora cactorum]